MGKQGPVGDRLRVRLLTEREQRRWSRATVRGELERRGAGMHISTIAKIEAGDRAVRPEELVAFADLFGVTVDALLGRRGGSDLVWAVSKLSSNAQRIANEVAVLDNRLTDEIADVHHYATGDGIAEIKAAARDAKDALKRARTALLTLAGLFPAGGIATR